MLKDELPASIVEVGCGAGLACAPLLVRSVKSSYIGIDRSAVARSRFQACNKILLEAGRAKFVQADFLDPPQAVEAGAGLAINVNAFWTKPEAAFAAMRHMLRPKSQLILIFEAPSEEKAASIAAILDSCELADFARLKPSRPLDGRTFARRYRRD